MSSADCMSKRAERRHHYERMKRRASRVFAAWIGHHDTPDARGRFARTRKPCSCYMCGNPRKHFDEPTVQERREMQA